MKNIHIQNIGLNGSCLCQPADNRVVFGFICLTRFLGSDSGRVGRVNPLMRPDCVCMEGNIRHTLLCCAFKIKGLGSSIHGTAIRDSSSNTSC